MPEENLLFRGKKTLPNRCAFNVRAVHKHSLLLITKKNAINGCALIIF